MEETPPLPPSDQEPAQNDLLPIPGDTYPLRAELKALGAVWDRAARVWVIAPEKLALAAALVANQGLLPAPQTAEELEDPFDAESSGPRMVALGKEDGATYGARDALQAVGARFDKTRRAWMIREERAEYARAVLAGASGATPSAGDTVPPSAPRPQTSAAKPAPVPPPTVADRPPLVGTNRGVTAPKEPAPPPPDTHRAATRPEPPSVAPANRVPPPSPSPSPSGMIRLGGLWLKQGPDGRRYLEGNLSPTVRLLVLPNADASAGTGEGSGGSGTRPTHVMFLAPPPEPRGDDRP